MSSVKRLQDCYKYLPAKEKKTIRADQALSKDLRHSVSIHNKCVKLKPTTHMKKEDLKKFTEYHKVKVIQKPEVKKKTKK